MLPSGCAGTPVTAAAASPTGVQLDGLGTPTLDQALLATLAYHDLLDLPLTAVECWRYLLRPYGAEERKTQRAKGKTSPLREVEQELARLVAAGAVDTRDGFYFFREREALVADRREKQIRALEKWQRLRRIVFWLQAIPFLRGVAATGSLTFDNAKPTSDLDVLVIAAENRVWTVRFLLTVLLDIFRLRRRPHGPTANRVCLNHYLAADSLEFPYRSLYTALEYARLVPLLSEETCRAFRAANRSWIEEYLVQVFPDTLNHRHTVRDSRLLQGVRRLGEQLLSGWAGNTLERTLARGQRARIARAEATTAPGGRVVATDARAEFHPQSREAPLLLAFNRRMEGFGLTETFGGQRDSGLTA
jgi:predicted nucleotidyltransferase